MGSQLHRKWALLVTVIGLIVMFSLATVARAIRIRSAALALTTSATKIRSSEDAEREIAKWRQQAGEHFWKESDRPGGDHSYDAQIENLSLSRLRIVEPTEATLGITMRGGKLRSITLAMTTGRKNSSTSSVWIQEWFDPDGAPFIRVNEKGRPWKATVDFTSAVADAKRQEAFALNVRCFVRMGGCRSAEEILPGVWQLAAEANTSTSYSQSSP